jgi:hypothetical protein
MDSPIEDILVPSILVLALLVEIAVLAWILLAAFRMLSRDYCTKELIKLRLTLEQIVRGLNGAEPHLEVYSPDDELYGEPTKMLLATRSKASVLYSESFQQYRYISHQRRQPHRTLVHRIWFGFWMDPYHSWQMLFQVSHLKYLIGITNTYTQQVLELLKDLQEKPREIASRIEKLEEDIFQSRQVVNELNQVGFQGATKDSVVSRFDELSRRLPSKPDYSPLKLNDIKVEKELKKATIVAWRILEQIERPIRQIGITFQSWMLQHSKISTDIQATHGQMHSAEQHFAQVPQSIVMEDLAEELRTLRSDTEQIDKRFRSPTVEVLQTLPTGIQNNTARANQLIAQFRDLIAKHRKLQETIDSNRSLLAQIKAALDEIEGSEQCPLVCQQKRLELANLNKCQEQIGRIDAPRELAKLNTDLSLAHNLNEQAKTLNTKVAKARTEQLALIDLFKAIEPESAVDFRDQADNLLGGIKEYAAANWSKEEAPFAILDEAEKLMARRGALTAKCTAAPIPEEGTGQLIADLESFLADRDRFHLRLRHIQETFEALKGKEDKAWKELKRTLSAIKNLNLLDAEFPFGVAIAGHRQNLNMLSSEGDKLNISLEKRGEGRVEDKARTVTTWVSSCKTTTQALYEIVQEETKQSKKRLAEKVDELHRWAPLNEVPAMKQANVVLQRKYAFDLARISTNEPVSVDHVVESTNTLSQERQEFRKLLARIASEIENPLGSYYQSMKKMRQQAHARIENLKKQVFEVPWPPVFCDLAGINDRWKRAEEEREQLRDWGDTIEDVRFRLRELSNKYAAIIDEVQLKIEEIGRQREDLGSKERRIEEWKLKLGEYIQDHSASVAIVNRANERINTITYELFEIRLQRLTFYDARNRLDELWEKARKEITVRDVNQTIIIKTIEAGGNITIEQYVRG